MVWIAAGLSDTLTSRKAMLQIHASRDWPFTGLIENSMGLQFLVAGVHPAVSVGVSGARELPTVKCRDMVYILSPDILYSFPMLG
jgi:hypothetical protein